MAKCECGNNVNPSSGIYCDDCINRRSEAYTKWAVSKITDNELHKILDKYEK